MRLVPSFVLNSKGRLRIIGLYRGLRDLKKQEAILSI